MRIFFTFFWLLICSITSFAQQPQVHDWHELIADSIAAMIMGDQATVSNASIQCANEGGGLFWGASGLDFSNGIVLTTGSTETTFSPNDKNDTSINSSRLGDAEMDDFCTSLGCFVGSMNACVLEFDFVPATNQIEVDYVFGSEEYPEWVGTSFNDKFFISIEGAPEYPKDLPVYWRNLALIPTSPSGNVAVEINTVNPYSYGEYYVDNSLPDSPSHNTIQYDGFTTNLTARATLTPGNTYHLRIVITDISDVIYDSGLFIRLRDESIHPFHPEHYRNLTVQTYKDDNRNEVWDETEEAMSFRRIFIEPLGEIYTTNHEGELNLMVDTGTYTIRPLPDYVYTTVNPIPKTLYVGEGNELDVHQFGYRPIQTRRLEIAAFWDENGNTLWDESEIPLNLQSFLLEPENKCLTTEENGTAHILLSEGDYQLSHKEDALWAMQQPQLYDISITEYTDEFPTYSFGLQAKRPINRVIPRLMNAPNRCNEIAPYWLHYQNTGTTIASGLVSFKTDELTPVIQTDPEPSYIENGIWYWEFDNLYPTHENKILLDLQMPDETYIGEPISTESTVQTFNEEEELVYSKTTTYDAEVECSYDPNDKLFSSNLLGQSQIAYIGDTLFYTIRFQNTGNASARNIHIEDVLDKKLDWTSFRPITASHDYSSHLDRNTGLITFYFKNIMLPDSASNEPDSHGFVLFSIASLSNLGDKTEVENTASIFFDFNPPIVTNTTNTVLIELDDVGIGGPILDINYSIFIYPNPFSDYTTIEVEGLPEGDYELEVMDLLGRKVRTLTLESLPQNLGGGKARLERGKLERGVYLFKVLEKESLEVIGGGKVLVE